MIHTHLYWKNVKKKGSNIKQLMNCQASFWAPTLVLSPGFSRKDIWGWSLQGENKLFKVTSMTPGLCRQGDSDLVLVLISSGCPVVFLALLWLKRL